MSAGRGRWLLAGIAVASLLVLGQRLLGPDDGGEGVPSGDGAASDGAVPVADTAVSDERSPFATADATPSDAPPSDALPSDAAVDDPLAAAAPASAAAGRDDPDAPPLDLQALGRTAIPDVEFEALVARLSRDSALLQALIDEFRSETDPERLARLSQLLGDVDDPAVALLATELVYAGDETSRLLGLDLLKRLRPGDPNVGDVVSGLLSSESDERILVGTLTAMARPGAADADTRAGLAGQVSLLTRHPEPSVRRTSLDILSRWSDSPEHTPLLLEGLADGDQSVRRTAAYALVGHEDTGESVVRGLFAVVENGSEEERTRRGAILALKGMPLEPEDRERVLEVERRLDLRAR